MKKAIQFGAGNIGRGFIGALLSNANYEVTFADVNQQVVDKINEEKKYTVHILDKEISQQEITNIKALNVNDPNLSECICDAEIITTAVGPSILSKIAPLIADGIKLRQKRGIKTNLNIIACENAIYASLILKYEIIKYLQVEEFEYLETSVGFPNCSVDRIVPPSTINNGNILDVVVESFYEWNVEKDGFKGVLPEIPGMNLTDNLLAYIERKLFTLNTGHALTAYLGYLKGYKTIEESINDEKIRMIVEGAMTESGEGLINKYGFDPEKHHNYIQKILNRFKNPHLKDDVSRVAREPLRKLGKNDRLIKPLVTARQYGAETPNLILGICAVLSYQNANDNQSIKLRQMIKDIGIEKTLQEIAGISPEDNILNDVVERYIKFAV